MIASVNSIDSVEQVRSSNKLSNNDHDERESAQRSDSIPKSGMFEHELSSFSNCEL
jgi:hypothetical protein